MSDMDKAIFDSKKGLPNKLLQEDGTITDLAGNRVISAVDSYENKPALPNKWLNPDGSYSTLSEIIGGAAGADLFIVVDELPATGEENKIYLVSKESGDGFVEWIYADGKWDTIGEYDIDLSNYPTTEQMEQYVDEHLSENVCNLGLVSDYTRENPLDLNSLELGTYLLYKRYSSHSLNMKATYKGKEITGSYSQDDDGVTLLCLYTLVTDSLAERDIVGVIKSFRIQENSPLIRVRTISIQISSDSISAGSGSYQSIEPVVLSHAQTITGLKTFNTLPKSTVAPTDDTHFVNKKYVDDAIAAAVEDTLGGSY